MAPYRLQDFTNSPSNFRPCTFGKIYRELYQRRSAAITAANRLLLHRSHEEGFGVRILNAQGAQVWSSAA